jgi:hypothetical protein
MELFNFSIKKIGVPVILFSFGRNYVLNEWSKVFYKFLPYQLFGEYGKGNADERQTPKGFFATRDVGAHMSYLIANYKGDRNESFMYGCD